MYSKNRWSDFEPSLPRAEFSGVDLGMYLRNHLFDWKRFGFRRATLSVRRTTVGSSLVGSRVMDAKKLKMARSLYADAKTQVVEICEGLGISRATFYRHIVAPAPITPGNSSE